MTDTPQVATRLTTEEFMALPETLVPTELIDGEVIVSPAPKDPHQKSSTHLLGWLVQNAPDGELRHQPTDLHLNGHVLQPDIFWVSAGNQHCTLGDDGYWYGLSPSTVLRDRGIKYEIYEQAGVREYWLVDTEAAFFEVYVREGEGFRRFGVFGLDQTFQSPVLNGQAVAVGAILGQESK